jgi:hypothetical protein
MSHKKFQNRGDSNTSSAERKPVSPASSHYYKIDETRRQLHSFNSTKATSKTQSLKLRQISQTILESKSA